MYEVIIFTRNMFGILSVIRYITRNMLAIVSGVFCFTRNMPAIFTSVCLITRYFLLCFVIFSGMFFPRNIWPPAYDFFFSVFCMTRCFLAILSSLTEKNVPVICLVYFVS